MLNHVNDTTWTEHTVDFLSLGKYVTSIRYLDHSTYFQQYSPHCGHDIRECESHGMMVGNTDLILRVTLAQIIHPDKIKLIVAKGQLGRQAGRRRP
jgi:hypothetical protein